jgi:hypothetical protein
VAITVNQKHPQYIARQSQWLLMRDTFEGEEKIKEKGTDYLPATGGQIADGLGVGAEGDVNYRRYKDRAVFHDLVRPAVQGLLGIMHRKPPTIELPPQLEKLRWNATIHGESLELLISKATEEQLLVGRYGLMLDVPDGGTVNELPFLVPYKAESIINWDIETGAKFRDRINLVVLDETDEERDPNTLSWSPKQRFKVLCTAEVAAQVFKAEGLAAGSYVVLDVEATDTTGVEQFRTPKFSGTVLNKVPFVFFGARDLVPDPDTPPLIGVARAALAAYRTEADYRQSLYMQGQDTLVIINGRMAKDKQQRVGATSTIEVDKDGDAKYISAGADGLQHFATAIENDVRRAEKAGAAILSDRGLSPESGEALRVRVGSRTATLSSVAKASAEGLERQLKNAAEWVGADPAQVVVKPNLDFTDIALQGQDMVNWMTAKALGAPVALRTIHSIIQNANLTQLTYEEETAEVDGEPPLPEPKGRGVGDE